MTLKSRPLTTVFSLSQFQILDGQYPKDDIVEGLAAATLGDGEDEENEERVPGSSSGSTGKVGCVSCGISSFGDGEAQREHVKCDWHRYNVKMRVLGRPTVSEDEFDALVEDDDLASISGSDDDEHDDEYDGSGSREDGSLAPYCIFRMRADDSADPQSVGFWKCLAVPDARSRQTLTTNAAYEDVCLAMEKNSDGRLLCYREGTLRLQFSRWCGRQTGSFMRTRRMGSSPISASEKFSTSHSTDMWSEPKLEESKATKTPLGSLRYVLTVITCPTFPPPSTPVHLPLDLCACA
jgi:hypothetical protein